MSVGLIESGTQTTLPFGTKEEVTRVCRRMIDEVGRGGGLLLAQTHVVEPEVPWENLMAFIEEALVRLIKDWKLYW